MTCQEFIEFMMDYSDGTLPAAQQTEFDAHLSQCPGCRDYLLTYQEAVRLGKAAATKFDFCTLDGQCDRVF